MSRPTSAAAERARVLLAESGRTFVSIAVEVGLSRERVRQLAVRMGIQAPARTPHYFRVCEVCGDRKQVNGAQAAARRRCVKHSYGYTARVDGLVCALCGVTFSLEGRAASRHKRDHKRYPHLQSWCPACVRPGKQTETRMCVGCGKPITRTNWPSQLHKPHPWVCSPACRGAWRAHLLAVRRTQ